MILLLLPFLFAIALAADSAVVWLAVEEVGQFTDLSFREAVGGGILLLAASAGVSASSSRD